MTIRFHTAVVLLFALAGCNPSPGPTTTSAVVVPRTWDDGAMKTLEIPLSEPGASPIHVSSDYYYSIPTRPIFKTYPVYAPDREPPGYIESLRQQKRELAFDSSKLKTEEDWIKAGEIVFDVPIVTGRVGSFDPGGPDLYVRDPKWYEATKPPLAKDGTLPFYRYVLTEKGTVEVGILACGMCHTRVMPDGSLVKGAQGNFTFDRAMAADYRTLNQLDKARLLERFLFMTPWLRDEFDRRLNQMSVEQIASAHDAIPAGVLARHRSSAAHPIQVPDLIGIKDRRYLDHTGLQLHRSAVDLMRYAALNQGADDLAQFGDFSPMKLLFDGKLPEASTQTRYTDEQLYALAMYLYAIEPPLNPNKQSAQTERGQGVFESEGCENCHTPPLYTNNALTPAEGFKIPKEHEAVYNIISFSVGTNPDLALKTRRGTGYYKVPSLKGVWYRGPFSHDGSVATLEDWFDPRRLREDYEPTGFKGYGVTRRAVPGHRFGLTLAAEDKDALIAFLRTL